MKRPIPRYLQRYMASLIKIEKCTLPNPCCQHCGYWIRKTTQDMRLTVPERTAHYTDRTFTCTTCAAYAAYTPFDNGPTGIREERKQWPNKNR